MIPDFDHPRKKTHRGKGKGGPGAQHHNALNKAMASGDHASAKKHALNLANALHGHVKGQQPQYGESIMNASGPLNGGAPTPAAPSGMGFLASALMRRK